LREFFTKGEELVRDLIAENERLRTALAQKGIPTSQDPTAVAVERLMRQVEALEAECNEIKRIAGSVERESGGYRDRLDALEREHYQLAAMYVAGNQFHAATTVDEVLRTCTEVLLNFVGIGRFTVFGVDEERQVLVPLLREGGAVSEVDELPLQPAAAPIAEALAAGGPWRSGRALGAASGVLAHLPLASGTRLVGLVRLERFLPQKTAFVDTDWAMLELVSEHAGIGIESAWIRAHAREVPLRRSDLEQLVSA
jgi:hypothetical protein